MAMNAERADLQGRYEAIYRFVRRCASSREDAEDLTQEVFLAAARELAQARSSEESPTLAWLYTVARRRLVDGLRRGSREPITVSSVIPAVSDERVYGPSVVQALLDGLRQLESDQRLVVALKLFEGRPFAEIALMVGASEEACRARFSRGLATLRSYLAEKGVTP
jgi:RNA polymerase sigma factor (sigma-70 family)